MEDRITINRHLDAAIPGSCRGSPLAIGNSPEQAQGVSMKETIGTCNDGKKRLRGMLRGVAHTMLRYLLLGWRRQGRKTNCCSCRVVRM
eukprot:20318-Hanusia_phi.AAC.1